MPWAVYVGILWLVVAAFAVFNLIPYATATAWRLLIPYSVLLVISLIAGLRGSRRA
jgi:hypothetical protein